MRLDDALNSIAEDKQETEAYLSLGRLTPISASDASCTSNRADAAIYLYKPQQIANQYE